VVHIIDETEAVHVKGVKKYFNIENSSEFVIKIKYKLLL